LCLHFALGLPVTVFAIRLFVFFRLSRYPTKTFRERKSRNSTTIPRGLQEPNFREIERDDLENRTRDCRKCEIFRNSAVSPRMPSRERFDSQPVGRSKDQGFLRGFALGKRVCDREQHASEGGCGHNAHARSIFENS
jgi:hypothetical protein